MDPNVYALIEPAVIFATLLGTAFGVKLLIWGKGPIRRAKSGTDQPALEQRIGELEERLEQMAELARGHVEELDELHERMDFAERLLTQARAEDPKKLEKPEVPTPA